MGSKKGYIYVVYEIGSGYYGCGIAIKQRLVTFSERRAKEAVSQIDAQSRYNRGRYERVPLGAWTDETIASYDE